MRESEIERVLVDEVKKLGGRAYKFVSPGNDGVPDRIVIFPDQRPIFVELKAESGKLTALQELQIKRLRELGQYVLEMFFTLDITVVIKGKFQFLPLQGINLSLKHFEMIFSD